MVRLVFYCLSITHTKYFPPLTKCLVARLLLSNNNLGFNWCSLCRHFLVILQWTIKNHGICWLIWCIFQNRNFRHFFQDKIHMATFPWTINTTTTGRDLISYRCQYRDYYMINVSTRTRSTWLHSRELSTPLPLGAIFVAIKPSY